MKRASKVAAQVSIFAMATALGVSVAPATVRADAAGDKALAALDEAATRAKTHHFGYDVTVKGDKTTNLSLDVRIKGEKRLTEFLAPADVKGTKVLILSPTQMYIFLPAFGKVRRIASHTTEQGFMGMTFTQDDMLLTTYGSMYTATVASDDGKTEKLVLTAKPDSGAPYPKLEITADKSNNMPTLVDYFSDSGAKIKTETRTGYTCESPDGKSICSPTDLVMVDHTKNDASTTLHRRSWKVNESMSDDMFTKRALDQGS